MKRFLFLTVLVFILGAAALLVIGGKTDSSAGTAPALAGRVVGTDAAVRGAYLATVADCIACHTVADSGQPFAGGVPFKLPVGTIYSSNITADPTYGIGGWSDDEFVRAVRDGIGRSGEHLYPAFPYTSYTKLSRDDVLAIKAYLLRQPAIPQANHANKLAFPFNQRWAVRFWNAAFFRDQRFSIDPSKSSDWNTGAYLVTALGHCAECHTPRNVAFGPAHGMELAGAELQGWRAYNITSDPKYGIGSWTAAELAAYLKTGRADRRASAGGPMGEAVAHSLQYLEADDLGAIVTYLRSVPPRAGAHPIEIETAPARALAAADAAPMPLAATAEHQGLALFSGACASCHQWNGNGLESPYAQLLGTRGVNDPQGANVIQSILQGARMRVGGSDVFMPAFASAYSNTEVAELANYVIAQFGGKQGRVTPDEVARRRGL